MSASPPPVRRQPWRVWLWLACFVWPVLPLLPAAETNSSRYFLRSWKTDADLPDNAVTAVVQTRDGYLWLSTYAGLARFDGARFVRFNSAQEPGLQSDRITSLYEDPKGALWIGFERGDLTCLREGKFEPQSVSETGVRRKICTCEVDAAGDVWMLDEEGTLVRVRDGATCALPNLDGVVQLAHDQEGKLWIASGGRLGTVTSGQLQTNDPAVFGRYIQGLCASHDGGIWILSEGGVNKWSRGAVVEERGTNPCNMAVTCMMETRSGCLAMGTSSDGLYLLFTNREVLHFNHANGFPSDWIRCLTEDREGTLWVGAGSEGVTALRPGKAQLLAAPDGWRGRVLLSPTVARDGSLWAGTEGAGLYHWDHGQWDIYGTSAGLSNLYVWSVSQDVQGRVWAATWGGGVFMQAGDHFVRPPGLEDVVTPMAATLQGANGVTWIGTASGLLRYQEGRVAWFGEKEGLKQPDVRAIAEAPDGTVWFGMLGGGLGRLQNGVVTQFQKGRGLASDYVQCLKLEAAGELWIGTYGSGLQRLKNGRFSHVTTADGLPNNFICAIEDDAAGNYWISTHSGVFRVARASLEACADGLTNRLSCLSLGKGDGLRSVECSGGFQPAACKFAGGSIGFPCSQGLSVLNLAEVGRNPLPPPVVIEELRANGRLLASHPARNAVLRIPPGAQRFEFHFTGLSFIAPEKVRVQYFLDGWDSDWTEVAWDKRVAGYSYIPPGAYTFRVRAGNSDDVWNWEGASVSLLVLPHFWQTWWFYVLASLLAAGMVAQGAWYGSRRRLRAKLEAAQRQQDIERERTRIAKDIHDHLGANLTRISLLSQSAHGELDNPAQAATQLDRIYETSRELTRAMDEIVWAVNPQHDTLDSLASYLGNFAQEYLGSIGLRCRLEVPLQLPHWPITAEMRHNLFLAFKEALHNIVKHSGASAVTVLLQLNSEGFEVELRDNGKGFDPAAVDTRARAGNGLKNMQQRMEKLGAHCDLQTTPGAGTHVKFRVTVPAAARLGH